MKNRLIKELLNKHFKRGATISEIKYFKDNGYPKKDKHFTLEEKRLYLRECSAPLEMLI